mmetsp:Transcript_17015/g.29288  ORF Transcript_17015/g.29288 Transcript_17015/m.29288 type:complete len:294 (-) Transcript_17015:118-999(-)|eukprot:CAMPEP_0183730502 /NCGR_PEP_ID=MMETSP0737-20130205/33020_1 /TAXON_ID=385413 /ORGANISM="Thalassiosira miniscula, Strain CCMP1093" /LENGTH=293 /DNA_ID=CAMNT_0025963021 /DNA_START=39 /DNA_END=920 /DNA_ORIENTATION=-
MKTSSGDNAGTLAKEQEVNAISSSNQNNDNDRLSNWKRPSREECPTCSHPLPIDERMETLYWTCCGKTMCCGCCREQILLGGEACPFCGDANIHGKRESLEQRFKLANSGNHKAICDIACFYCIGDFGLKRDLKKGFTWYHRAVDAGSALAALILAQSYKDGDVVEKDVAKSLEFLHKAADLGAPHAFEKLGIHFMEEGDDDNGMLYLRKAVMCGLSEDYLLKLLRYGFKSGFITEVEYTNTLRQNHEAANEMKTDLRERFKKSEQMVFMRELRKRTSAIDATSCDSKRRKTA